MRKWQHVALTAALTVATAGGVAFAGVAANAKPAIPTPPASRRQRRSTAAGPSAANMRVVEAFLQDVLDGHHGDHAANYLTKDAQFHAGTVGNFTGRRHRRGGARRHRRRDPRSARQRAGHLRPRRRGLSSAWS